MAAAESSAECAFCGEWTATQPITPSRTVLVYHDAESGQQRSVQLPRTVRLCHRCSHQLRLLAGCPRCRRYGRYPPYGQGPYGPFCVDCGGRLYRLNTELPPGIV